jgi:hypothetical protein
MLLSKHNTSVPVLHQKSVQEIKITSIHRALTAVKTLNTIFPFNLVAEMLTGGYQ